MQHACSSENRVDMQHAGKREEEEKDKEEKCKNGKKTALIQEHEQVHLMQL